MGTLGPVLLMHTSDIHGRSSAIAFVPEGPNVGEVAVLRTRWWLGVAVALFLAVAVPSLGVADESPIDRSEYGHLSGWLANQLRGGLGGVGGGSLPNRTCAVAGNPAANIDLSCDDPISPDNETPIVADPTDPIICWPAPTTISCPSGVPPSRHGCQPGSSPPLTVAGTGSTGRSRWGMGPAEAMATRRLPSTRSSTPPIWPSSAPRRDRAVRSSATSTSRSPPLTTV